MKKITVKFLRKTLAIAVIATFVFSTFANAKVLENSDYEYENKTMQLTKEETTGSLPVVENISDFDADETATRTTEVAISNENISGYIETAATSTNSISNGTWIEASDGRWWYRHADGTYTRNNWEKIDGKWYYFDAGGWMLTGWQKINGYWYYFKPGDSGWMVTEWYKVGSNWYYLGTDGKMRTGWQKLDGSWYYFNLGDSGRMLTGWQKISSVWYYLGTDGKMRTGWQQVSGKWYYLGTDGKMRTGWHTIDGKKYYFNPGDSGNMILGWKKIDGYYYYFNSGGIMNTDSFSDDKCYYIFYSSGKLCCVESRISLQVQEKSNWCWAACSSMAGEFITGTRISQANVVRNVKMFAINSAASDAEVIKALNYTSGGTLWEAVGTTDFNFQNVVDKLDSKKIFAMHISWNANSGHLVLCGGYRLSNQSLRVVDPIKDVEPIYFNYYKLRIKQNLVSGVGKWDRTFKY